MNTKTKQPKGNSKPELLPERCDHNEMVRDPVGKYGYWMCAKCFKPYDQPQAEHSPLPQDDITRSTLCQFDWSSTDPVDMENAKLIVRSVNNAEALAEALRDIELRTTQARIASGIGKRKNRTEFLLGELERIAGAAREALARWEAK